MKDDSKKRLTSEFMQATLLSNNCCDTIAIYKSDMFDYT